MKAIVGSSTLWPTPALASAVLLIMTEHAGETFGVRCTRKRVPASAIEEMVMRIGTRIGTQVLEWPPIEIGSSAGFKRDISLVSYSNELFAFFAPDSFMEGGTGHVVTCALREGIPVHAYQLDAEGRVVESASDEGDLLALYKEGR